MVGACVFIISGLLIGCGKKTPPTDSRNSSESTEHENGTARTPDKAVRAAVDYLMSQQGEDGGWHAPAYGNLRPGAAITSFVLYSLSYAPAELTEPYRDDLIRGREFLVPGIERNGYVSNPDGSPDYSNYATAMLLVADERLGLGLSDTYRNRMIDYLVAAQLGEAQEYGPENADYGGWDLSGWMIGPRKTTGTNISVTAVVVQALQESAGRREDVRQSLKRAEAWLKNCQNLAGDGGFHFHPQRDHHGNKAMWQNDERSQAHSYGTATADGLRILRLLDIPAGDTRHDAAKTWFTDHDQADIVPGFGHLEPSTGWEEGLWFYFMYSRSMIADDALFEETNSQAIKRLVEKQRADGSWENANARMREDDPLIATPFALIALCNLRSVQPSR